MMFKGWVWGGAVLALSVGSSPVLLAQGPTIAHPLVESQDRPLVPMPDDGLPVIPFLDGWYENADGSHSISFGYYNLNRDIVVEVPIGADNFIEPKEFDGVQPTVFQAPAVEENPGGSANRRGALPPQRERTRGAFTVTIPPDFKGDVVWTIRSFGEERSVPGRIGVFNYMLSWPAAMGSVPPVLRFEPGGPTGQGPMGVRASQAVQAKVGVPVTLTAWMTDDSDRTRTIVEIKPRGEGPAPINNVAWYKHQGPVGAEVTFDPVIEGVTTPDGKLTTTATFSTPGEYVVRVVVDDHGAVDSSWGNQCCWTNGYLNVTVTP